MRYKIAVVLATVLAPTSFGAPCNNEIKLAVGKYSEAVVLNLIKANPSCTFDVSLAALEELEKAGATAKVIEAVTAKMAGDASAQNAEKPFPAGKVSGGVQVDTGVHLSTSPASSNGGAHIVAGSRKIDLQSAQIEQEAANLKRRVTGSVMFRVPKAPYLIPGETSGIVIEASSFDIVMPDTNMPTAMMLVKAKIEDGNRILFETNNLMSSSKLDADKVNVKPIRSGGTITFQIREHLDPGEYAVIQYPYAWPFTVGNTVTSKLD